MGWGGWSPSTRGLIRGPVIYFNARSEEDFAEFKGKLKGAIIISTEPQSLSPPAPAPQSPMLFPMQSPPPLPGQPAPPSPFARLQEVNRKRNQFMKDEGVAAILRDSGKPHALLDMTRGGEKFNVGEIPTAFITGESYRLLWRLQKRGAVVVELEMTNSFSDKPVEVYNTVAELRGTEKPGEVVILGAHLDSWDLGEGSTDNGTGSMPVLAAGP